MVQTSYFWDGTSVGDATLAPYDDAEIATIMDDIYGYFVVPGYLFGTQIAGDELTVKGDTVNVGKVIVYPGVAMVRGVLYIIDEEVTLDVPATAGANPAIYRVILDKDTATQTVRVGIKQGAEAAAPRPPTVASNEVSIAWLYITGAYDHTIDLFDDSLIHDERVFKYIGPDAQRHVFENILHNPEFMATSGGTNTAPDGWVLVNTPATSFGTGGGRTVRGKWVRFQGGAGEGIETTVPINRGSTMDGEIWTIRGYIEVDAQSLTVDVYVDILDGGTILFDSKTFWVMASPGAGTEGITEFIMRIRINPLSTEQNAIRIVITSDNAATDAYIGDMAVIPGYVAGTKESVRKSELIWLDNAIADVNWTATAKSTGTTTISLNVDFGGIIPRGVRGVVLRVRCRDSGSAGAAVADGTSIKLYAYTSTIPSAVVSCTGLPNDEWESGLGWVSIWPNDTSSRFAVVVTASGAGTLDATLEIIGIIT